MTPNRIIYAKLCAITAAFFLIAHFGANLFSSENNAQIFAGIVFVAYVAIIYKAYKFLTKR
jgi:hypothetical protein